MKIGITYDLKQDYLALGYKKEDIAELDRIETIDAIENALKNLNFETERIGNIHNLVTKLANGEKWDLVFNIAEGLHGLTREAQVPALLDAYNIPYVFSDSLVLALSLHKGITKTLIRAVGVPTADFYIVNSKDDIGKEDLPFPLFAKPALEGTSKGINALSKIKTKEELQTVCQELLEKYKQPILVETYLSGREFTVGITGTGEEAQAVGVLEILMTDKATDDFYSFDNKANFEECVTYKVVQDEIADQCIEKALEAWRGLNCRDGGRVDLRYDDKGVPNFIEVNPLAGLNPDDSDLPIMCNQLGITYQELINRIMASATKRVGLCLQKQ